MFGRKTKRIKVLEESIENCLENNLILVSDNRKLYNENTNLRLDNGRLRNEVGNLQSQVQRLGLVRNNKGQFKSIK